MKKILILLLSFVFVFALCSCGESSEEPTAYSPTDIQVEAIDDEGSNVYTLVYDIDGENTDEWSGYWDSRESETAINGIKECIECDDWTPTSVVYGKDADGTILYSYGYDGTDGDYDNVKFFQVGIFHKSYGLDGLL